MQDLRDRFHKNRGEIRMIDILISRKGLGVTDQRDMLYAHKGLASDALNLNVDYSASCAGLYADIAFHGMVKYSNHGILSYVHDGPAFSRLAGLPSWCPDWSQARSISELPRHCSALDYDAPPLPAEDSPHPKFAKEIFREGHALIQHQGSRVLTCLGIELAVVTHINAPLSSKYIEHTKQEYFSSRLTSLRKIWRELGSERSAFGKSFLDRKFGFWWDDFRHGNEVVNSFSQSIKQHIKSLRDLYAEIYTAWQSTVDNELIMPSLASLTAGWTQGSKSPEIIEGGKGKHGFLSDERIFAFGCWIFRDVKESIDGQRHDESPDFPVYHFYHEFYESTVDLLVQYFLPGFDKGIIDGRVLTQTTLWKNSLFLCLAPTAVGDYLFNLLPIFYREFTRHFVMRDCPGKETWIKETREEMSEKLGWHDDLEGKSVKDLSAIACTLVGEAYGMINMYCRLDRLETQDWTRLFWYVSGETRRGHDFSSLYDFVARTSNDVYGTEKKILAIF